MMKMKVMMLLAAFAVLAVGGTAQAGMIAGGSFESPDLADGTNNVSDATTHDWTPLSWTSADNGKSGTHGAGVEDPSVNKTDQTGDQYGVSMFGYNGSDDVWIKINSASLGTVLASYTYTFEVDMTWDSEYGGGIQPAGSNPWGNYNTVSLILNGHKFNRNHGTLPKNDFTLRSIEVVVDASGNLESHNADGGPAIGTALASGDITVTLMAGRDSGAGGSGKNYMLWDNVRLDAVPEPVTMALLGLGGLGVLIRRRRRA